MKPDLLRVRQDLIHEMVRAAECRGERQRQGSDTLRGA